MMTTVPVVPEVTVLVVLEVLPVTRDRIHTTSWLGTLLKSSPSRGAKCTSLK
jgi:hypothetical protein